MVAEGHVDHLLLRSPTHYPSPTIRKTVAAEEEEGVSVWDDSLQDLGFSKPPFLKFSSSLISRTIPLTIFSSPRSFAFFPMIRSFRNQIDSAAATSPKTMPRKYPTNKLNRTQNPIVELINTYRVFSIYGVTVVMEISRGEVEPRERLHVTVKKKRWRPNWGKSTMRSNFSNKQDDAWPRFFEADVCR